MIFRKLRNRKKQRYKKAKRTGKDCDWREYREARSKLQQTIRRAKMQHEEKLAKKIKDCNERNDKLGWKLTKRFYNKTNNTKHESPPQVTEGKSEIVNFTRKGKTEREIEVTRDNTLVTQVFSRKHLGVILQPDGKQGVQTEELIKKTSG